VDSGGQEIADEVAAVFDSEGGGGGGFVDVVCEESGGSWVAGG